MTKPIAQIHLSVEFEVEYDPFEGRTLADFASNLEDDLHLVLNDFRPDDVLGIFSKVNSTQLVNEDEH